MSEKLPAMQFYTGDWLKDPGVRSLSVAARGLWFDILCCMHESERRGYLVIGGRPPSHIQLSRIFGVKIDLVSRYVQEIENAGVSSRTEEGILYSRRMVKDERRRQLCVAAGKRGGNPKLTRTLKGPATQTLNRNPTPSVSVSTSVTTTTPPSAETEESAQREKPAFKRKPCVDGLVFEYLQRPRDTGGLGLSASDAARAGAMLKGKGGTWTPPKLAALLYALAQDPKPTDPIAFARGCLTGKTQARADFQPHEERAALVLAWARKKADAAQRSNTEECA